MRFLTTCERPVHYLLMLFRVCLVLAVGLVLAWPPRVTARQEQALSDVLQRAGSYVEAFQNNSRASSLKKPTSRRSCRFQV